MKPVIVDRTQPNEFITRFVNYVSGGDLLDMGAGHGRHAKFASEHGFDVTAVEPDTELCAILEQIPGGINVISAYTDQNASNFMADNPYGDHQYLLKPGELKSYYDGWEILEYEESWTPPGIINEGDTPQSFHKVNMIAQRS